MKREDGLFKSVIAPSSDGMDVEYVNGARAWLDEKVFRARIIQSNAVVRHHMKEYASSLRKEHNDQVNRQWAPEFWHLIATSARKTLDYCYADSPSREKKEYTSFDTFTDYEFHGRSS